MKDILFGLDLGSKTLGIAVSDGLGLLAHPVTTLTYKNHQLEDLLDPLETLVKQYQVKGFVLGNPLHMHDQSSLGSQRSLDFKALLEERFNLPVSLSDERLTTALSERKLIMADVKRKKRKQVIDQMAAVEILQSELERRK